MNITDAIALDRSGDVVQASSAYEQVLLTETTPSDALVNLIVLYWQSTDYGFSVSRSLPASFVERASARLHILLNNGDRQNLFRADFLFWRRYIGWADLGEAFDLDECRRIMRSDRNYLEPAMFIFSVSEGEECLEQAKILLEQCVSEGTIRSKYVESVIKGLMKRR